MNIDAFFNKLLIYVIAGYAAWQIILFVFDWLRTVFHIA